MINPSTLPISPFRSFAALALSSSLFLQTVPARANPAAVAAVPCLASGACVLVLVGATFVIVQMANGQRVRVPLESYPTHSYPVPQPGPRPLVPQSGAVYSRKDIDRGNIPGVQEVHYVMGREYCRDMFNRLRQQGVRLDSYEFWLSKMPGSPRAGHCLLKGPGAVDNRYADHDH